MSRWLIGMIALTVLTVGGTLWLWYARRDLLLDPLPVHWNAEGKVDRDVPLAEAAVYVFLTPALQGVVLALTFALPWLSPRKFDVNRFRPTFHYVMFLVSALFAYLNVAILINCLKDPPFRLDIGTLIMGGMFLFFALMGNVMGKVKPNFYVGVRTPWTIASEAVWVGTHRLAAWLWTAGALVGLVLVVVAAVIQTALQIAMPWFFIPLFVGFMILVLFPVPYSLYLYKRLEKEGKLEPAGETQLK
jgi:uncharacterized membrane protein